jgi:hypothetical protein
MSISELAGAPTRNADDALFAFERLHLREADLHSVRTNLYHSSGDGFHVFRGFISPEIVEHIRWVWTTVDPAPVTLPFPGSHGFYVGCPNYHARYDDGSFIFYNFFFRPPLDEVTHEVSACVHLLRNRLSGRNALGELAGPRAVSYRVTHNLNRAAWAPAHNDFMNYDRRWVKGEYDPSRLQATLFLSEKGVDYSGTGFRMVTNRGRSVRFGDEVPIDPGDLVIWRYGNLHAVEDISTEPGQFGFLRVLYPVHDLPVVPPAAAAQNPLSDLPYRLARRGKAVARGAARRVLGRVP